MTKTVLVVEDESLIAMLIEDHFVDAGYAVHVAPNVETALGILREHAIDVAVLDVNLGGTLSTPVAHELKRRNIPFLIATGYGLQGVDEAFRDRTCLPKPFRLSDLDRAVRGLETAPGARSAADIAPSR